MTLGAGAQAWWKWAWSTPQAAAWGAGVEVVVARRALLEDMLDAIEAEKAGTMLQRMLDLDRQLGLTPKAMADLRWEIVQDEVAEARAVKVVGRAPTQRLRAVDPRAVAGA